MELFDTCSRLSPSYSHLDFSGFWPCSIPEMFFTRMIEGRKIVKIPDVNNLVKSQICSFADPEKSSVSGDFAKMCGNRFGKEFVR